MSINVKVTTNNNRQVLGSSGTGSLSAIVISNTSSNGDLPLTGVKVSTNGNRQINFSTNASPLVIKNNALLLGTELKTLDDVVMQDLTDGNTLVYRSSDEKFVLESADSLNFHNIDGGSF